MGEMLEIAKTLVEPGVKLIDAVQSAIGKAYEPTHVRNMADAKAYEISKVASAMREASDVPIIYNKGDLSLDTTDFDAFVKRTQSRMAYQELQKQGNIEAVISKAYKMLDGGERVTNDPLDSDWINRLFNCVGEISNEKMQKIWASILAGEVKRPSSFSLRTLETLRNISAEEAELFQKIANYVVETDYGKFLPSNERLLKQYNITISEIISLGECGLINTTPVYEVHYVSEDERCEYFKYAPYVIKVCDKAERRTYLTDKYAFGLYPLTKAGLEISGLFEQTHKIGFAFSLAFAIEMCEREKKVEIHKIIREDGEVIVISSNDFIEDMRRKTREKSATSENK